MSNYLDFKTTYQNTPLFKLFSKMSLFWNLILRISSFIELNILQIEFYVYFYVELEINNVEFHLNFQKNLSDKICIANVKFHM